MSASSPPRSPQPLSMRHGIALVAAFGMLGLSPNLALAGPEPLSIMRAATHAPTLQDLIAEASRRFGVSASWIAEVMSVESRGHANALSPKGAIGLMQVMPETYADMRARYGLGANPWNPRDNVLAGAAYLRLLYNRYGAPGFLVAYNAGPGRWYDYQLRGRPLPLETVAYLARLGPVVGRSEVPLPTLAAGDAPRSPLASPIFVRLASMSTPIHTAADRERIVRIIDANASVVPHTDAIFVARPRPADMPPDRQSANHRNADDAPSGSTPVSAPPSSIPARNRLFPERTSAGSTP